MKKGAFGILLICISFQLQAMKEDLSIQITDPITKNQIFSQLAEIREYPAYIGYVNIRDIRPGQIRYSQQNVDAKIQAAMKKKWTKRMDDNSLQPQFFNNTSMLPSDQALPVVVGPRGIGLVLVDGHHDTISSLQTGATTIPVKVVANLSDLSPAQFWLEVIKRNFVYPYDSTGRRLNRLPAAWSWGSRGNLQDDANRYFAAIAARKCAKKDQPVKESTGADYPLWVKVGKDIPFIEFMISDVLTQAGLHYSDAMGEDFSKEPLKSFAERARKALKTNAIKGLKLVPERIHYTDINKGDLCGYEGL